MSKCVFISYHFNDKTYKGEIVKWVEDAGVKVISVDEKDLSPEGDKIIEARIKEQIGSCNKIIILVGNDTHNRPWIDYEVAVARSKGIKTYWVRLSNRTGAAPKEVRNLDCINYERKEIINILNH
jgi:ACT domain-containing protein